MLCLIYLVEIYFLGRDVVSDHRFCEYYIEVLTAIDRSFQVVLIWLARAIWQRGSVLTMKRNNKQYCASTGAQD